MKAICRVRSSILCIAAASLFAGTAYAQPRLVADWSFDSTAGSTYYDVTGHGFDAIGSGSGLSLVKGIHGNALNCSGSGFELYASNSRANFACSKFTIEMMYYPNIDPATQISYANNLFCFHYVQSGVRNGYAVDIVYGGQVAFAISSNDGTQWITVHSTTVLKAATWYHIVATYDSATLKLYINGLQEGTLAHAGTYPLPAVDAHIGCQKRMDNQIYYQANGRFDEVKFYNYALSADTIAAHGAALLPVPVLIPYTPNPTYSRRPVLRWFSNQAIPTYRVQVATDQTFKSPFVSVPTSDTVYASSVDLPYGTIWWRVGNEADSSLRSITSSFMILDSTVPLLIPYTPDPTRNRQPTLRWHAVRNSTSYTIQVSATPGFSSPFISDAVSDSVYPVSVNLPIGTIYWHVKSSLSAQYSSPDTFVVQNDSLPYLVSMVPDTQYVRRPGFKWYHAAGASSYRIQIDTIGNFANPLISTPVSDTQYLPLADLPFGKIYWRVGANTNPNLFSAPDTFLLLPAGAIANRYHFVEAEGPVRVQVFSLDGRLLASKTYLSNGRKTGIFNGKEYHRGVYVFRLVRGKSVVSESTVFIGK